MGKFKLEEILEKYKALQKKLEKLQSTSGTTPEQVDEVKKELEATSMLIRELEKEENAKEAQSGKISQEVFTALKRQLLEVAPQVKNEPDPKAAAAIAALKVSDCKIVASAKGVILLDAGAFGIRKVVID
jgi:chromosome segregation ATPase